MSTGPDALAAMRTMMASGLGTPLFIDDVPNHLHRLAEQMRGAARLSDALATAPAFTAEHSARADTMRHAAMMVQALGLNISAALQLVADEQALSAELAEAISGPIDSGPFDDDTEPHGIVRPLPYMAECAACMDTEPCVPDESGEPVCEHCWATWADSDEPWGAK